MPEVDVGQVRQAIALAKRSSHGWFRGPCPFCILRKGTPDKRTSFCYFPDTGRWRCLRCGAWGRYTGGRDHAPELPTAQPDLTGEEEWQRLPRGFSLLDDKTAAESVSLNRPRAYLRSRGIDERTSRAARIGTCYTRDPRWRWRIIIPIYAPTNDRLSGYYGRAYDKDVEPQHRYATGMPRGSILYNQAAVYVETGVPLLLVEACLDALSYWPNASAFLGKPTDDQTKILLQARRPLAVCFDGDSWEEGEAYAMLLQLEGARAGSVRLPACEDPNSVPPQWLNEQAHRCVEA